ncbi:MAG: GntR family transcriptional regulator [Lachnospiraceae bacterium]|nr:GntR family transcriptional regulator [Lachnospiraceae bacterium]
MYILIDNKSGEPIYNQIFSQIREQIVNGELKENEMLPSIRSLAGDLRISFLTTKHAYDELEKEGFIYTVPGKGSFVAARNTELIREESLRKIEEHLGQIAQLAANGGIGKEEVMEMIGFCLEDLQ